jgi:ATP-dependent Clp protease ATP-binding subunit ClpA
MARSFRCTAFGATGVGKTELAKAIAELIFSTEEACIRFDMSEYSQPHTDQRLLGAPPGYIGYEEGGQLTNRVKNNPFCVLLFDEIEKAHPSILDKFLQILEDGRMTDGRGETVYFSESLIIFTSNAGIYEIDPETMRHKVDPETGRTILNVNPEMHKTYEDVQKRVSEGVKFYFKQILRRPELLNRIGQNIIVFDFLRPAILRDILEQKVLPAISNQIQEKHGIGVHFSQEVVDQIMDIAGDDVENGGRGIGNFVELSVLNPLARILFARRVKGEEIVGTKMQVKDIIPPNETGPSGQYNLNWEIIA